jgi:hypothetical protein
MRYIFFISIFTEWANEGPYKWSEMEKFLKDVETLPSTVAAWVGSELPKVREELKSLIDKGEFNKVTTILTNTDLQKVAGWYANKSK